MQIRSMNSKQIDRRNLESMKMWLVNMFDSYSGEYGTIEMKDLARDFQPEGGVTSDLIIHDPEGLEEPVKFVIEEMTYAEAEEIWRPYLNTKRPRTAA